MPPCRICRPEARHGKGAWRRGVPRRWVPLILAGLIWCGNDGAALAQAQMTADAPKPPTAAAIRKGCAGDHAQFCPHGQGGTRADIACLQQHHVDLTLGCRTLLGQAATPQAGTGVPQ